MKNSGVELNLYIRVYIQTFNFPNRKKAFWRRLINKIIAQNIKYQTHILKKDGLVYFKVRKGGMQKYLCFFK